MTNKLKLTWPISRILTIFLARFIHSQEGILQTFPRWSQLKGSWDQVRQSFNYYLMIQTRTATFARNLSLRKCWLMTRQTSLQQKRLYFQKGMSAHIWFRVWPAKWRNKSQANVLTWWRRNVSIMIWCDFILNTVIGQSDSWKKLQ